MRPWITIVTASLAALVGCSTTILSDPHRTEACYRGHIDEAVLQQELDSAAPCCSNFSGMSFERLSWPARTDTTGGREGPLPAAPTVIEYPFSLAFSRRAPVYLFASGKSRFVSIDISALQRPPVSFTVVPKHAGITSGVEPCDQFPTSAAVPGATRYVAPVATFLDSAANPISEAVAGAPTVFMGDGALEFEVPSRTRYVVLHTRPNQYGDRLSLQGKSGVTALLIPGAGIVPVPYDGSRVGVIAATGSIDLFFHY